MRKYYLPFALCALLCAQSCYVQESRQDCSEITTFKAIQSDAPKTKTVLQSDGSVFWSSGDAINVFFGENTSAQFTTNNTTPAAQTDFSGSLAGYVPNTSNYVWAVYPYEENNEFNGAEVTLTLPSMQVGVAGTFADNLFISMARSNDLTLQFYNVCGGVKFCVANEGIKYVTFSGNANEVLAGKVKVAFDNDGKPKVQEILDGKKELRLSAPDGESFEVGKWYYMVSLPTTLTSGFTMSFYNEEKVAERISDKTISIKRAIWGKLTDADVVPQPNNEIWYTSTDGNIVVPTNTGVFGAVIVSNTYSNGKGIIRFDGDVTMVGDDDVYLYDDTNTPFNRLSTLLSISLPESVKSLGHHAFFHCNKLKEIHLPSHLEFWSEDAISRCPIIELFVPQTDTWQGEPIQSCEQLQKFSGPYAAIDERCLICDGKLLAFAPADVTDYTLPDGIVEIGTECFYSMSKIKSLVLPQSVEIIGSHAFGYCYGLEEIQIPQSLKTIASAAFSSTGLKTIHIPESADVGRECFGGCTALRSFTGHYASDDDRCLIKEGKVIGFAQADLVSYTFPEGITCIELSISDGGLLLESLVLPSTLTSIYDYPGGPVLKEITCLAVTPPSFQGRITSPKLQSIFVPSSSLADYKAAEGWSDYADLIFPIDDSQPNNEIWYTTTDGEIITPYTENGFGATLISNTYKDGKGVMRFDGPVTSIARLAFYYCCKNLSSIIIPSSVTTIGSSAFTECSALSWPMIPSSVTTIGSSAFFGCYAFTDVFIPETVTEFGSSIFQACMGLKNISGKGASSDGRCLVFDGVLNSFAFDGLGDSYSLPNNITVIGASALRNCDYSGTLVLGNNVKSIGVEAFAYSDMSSIEIGQNVEYVATSAFRECNAKELEFPASLLEIGPDNFGPKFSKLIFHSNNPPKASGSLFYNTCDYPIYVPASSVEAYKTASYWSEAADRIFALPSGTNEGTSEEDWN